MATPDTPLALANTTCLSCPVASSHTLQQSECGGNVFMRLRGGIEWVWSIEDENEQQHPSACCCNEQGVAQLSAGGEGRRLAPLYLGGEGNAGAFCHRVHSSLQPNMTRLHHTTP
jgi:hypothetical protein